MSRVLVIASESSYNAEDFLRAAERLGVAVQVASDRCHVLAEVWPEGAWSVDLRHPAEAARQIAERAAELPVDGIVATDEITAVVASLAAARLGIAHNPSEATRAAADKLLFRRALTRAGVSQPDFWVVSRGADPRSLELEYPVVLKPLHLSASRGVMRADDPDQLAARFERLCRLLADEEVRRRNPDAAERILIESFVPGTEHAFEGLLRDGELVELALFDKPDTPAGPFFAETIYVTPSELPAQARAAARDAVAATAAALGLREGPVHAELRIGEHGPVMLELAARSIGGLCSRALEFGAGISLEELIISHAVGRDPESVSRGGDPATGVMMIPVPAAGVLRSIDGVDRAQGTAGIHDVVISARVGDNLVPLPEGKSYMGFLFARGETPAEVTGALRRAFAAIRFRIAPRL